MAKDTATIALEMCKLINPDNPQIVAENIFNLVESLKKSPKYQGFRTCWDKDGNCHTENYDTHEVLRKILPQKERPKLVIHNRDGSDTVVEPLKTCPGWSGKEVEA